MDSIKIGKDKFWMSEIWKFWLKYKGRNKQTKKKTPVREVRGDVYADSSTWKQLWTDET